MENMKREDMKRDNMHAIWIVIMLFAFSVFSIFFSGCLEWPEKEVKITPISVTEEENVTNVTNETEMIVPIELIIEKTCEELLELAIESDEAEDLERYKKCVIKRAYDRNNPKECDILNELNETAFTKCVFNVSQKNVNHCFHFNDTILTDTCILEVAEIHGESACNLVFDSSTESECFLIFVNESCRGLSDVFERYLCDGIAKDNEKRCEKSGDNDLCLIKFSREKRDVCNLIIPEWKRKACEGIILDNDEKCLELASEISRNGCYELYGSETPDCIACEKITTMVYKDNCHKNCGLNSNDSTQCSKLSTETGRDNCYYDYGLEKLDWTPCDKIILKSLMRSCYRHIGIELGEPIICDNLDFEYHADCYMEVIAARKITNENCMKMNPSYIRDQCVLQVVKNKNDKTFCENINDSGLREYCKKLEV